MLNAEENIQEENQGFPYVENPNANVKGSNHVGKNSMGVNGGKKQGGGKGGNTLDLNKKSTNEKTQGQKVVSKKGKEKENMVVNDGTNVSWNLGINDWAQKEMARMEMMVEEGNILENHVEHAAVNFGGVQNVVVSGPVRIVENIGPVNVPSARNVSGSNFPHATRPPDIPLVAPPNSHFVTIRGKDTASERDEFVDASDQNASGNEDSDMECVEESPLE